jgi:hypothetical protein
MSRPHPRPWHRGSQFGDGLRCPRDRNQRARFKYLLAAHYRAGRLPAKQERVGLALLKRLGTDGQCDPAYDTLASDAGCSARTARRATVRMREFGLLHWQRRLVRTDWRAEQTSNQYVLISTAPEPAPRVPRCGGQSGRETSSIKIQSLFAEPDVLAAEAALARRRAVIEGRLLMNKGSGQAPAI